MCSGRVSCIAEITGHNYMGHNYMGHNAMGHNCMGHNYMGHSYMGHNATGHDYTGNNYIPRSDLSIAQRCREPWRPQPPTSRLASPPPSWNIR